MQHRSRAGIGLTFAGLALALGAPLPASAGTGSADRDGEVMPPAPAVRIAVCRYWVDATKDVPMHSGPGKKYTVHGKISMNRAKPLFGTCAKMAGWVKIVQGGHKGAWVWRNHLSRKG